MGMAGISRTILEGAGSIKEWYGHAIPATIKRMRWSIVFVSLICIGAFFTGTYLVKIFPLILPKDEIGIKTKPGIIDAILADILFCPCVGNLVAKCAGPDRRIVARCLFFWNSGCHAPISYTGCGWLSIQIMLINGMPAAMLITAIDPAAWDY